MVSEEPPEGSAQNEPERLAKADDGGVSPLASMSVSSNDVNSQPMWWRLETLTFAMVLVTAAAVVASFLNQRSANSAASTNQGTANAAASRNQGTANATAIGLQLQAQHDARSSASQAGQNTACIYLARVNIEKKGLTTMLQHGRVYQDYLGIQDFDASVSDGLALLAAQHPRGIITDLSHFYGELLLTYQVVLSNVPLQSVLTRKERGIVGGAVSGANALLHDLRLMTLARPKGYLRPAQLTCPAPK